MDLQELEIPARMSRFPRRQAKKHPGMVAQLTHDPYLLTVVTCSTPPTILSLRQLGQLAENACYPPDDEVEANRLGYQWGKESSSYLKPSEGYGNNEAWAGIRAG
jgi:hypothetical protein